MLATCTLTRELWCLVNTKTVVPVLTNAKVKRQIVHQTEKGWNIFSHSKQKTERKGGPPGNMGLSLSAVDPLFGCLGSPFFTGRPSASLTFVLFTSEQEVPVSQLLGSHNNSKGKAQRDYRYLGHYHARTLLRPAEYVTG